MRLALFLIAAFACTASAQSLKPAACGVRNTLWIEHYSAQLYVPADASINAVGDPAQPKALRMRMLNTYFMPPEIPRKWRDALQPVLEAQDMKRLQAGYGRLQPGDTVLVTYQPQKGLALSINDRTVVAVRGHAVIDALLAAWAEDAPVEKKLAGTASRNRCA